MKMINNLKTIKIKYNKTFWSQNKHNQKIMIVAIIKLQFKNSNQTKIQKRLSIVKHSFLNITYVTNIANAYDFE